MWSSASHNAARWNDVYSKPSGWKMAALREKKILLFKFLAMLSGLSPTPLATPSSTPLCSGSYLHQTSKSPPHFPHSVMGFWTSGVLLKVEPQRLMCDPDTCYEHNGSALRGGGSCSKGMAAGLAPSSCHHLLAYYVHHVKIMLTYRIPCRKNRHECLFKFLVTRR